MNAGNFRSEGAAQYARSISGEAGFAVWQALAEVARQNRSGAVVVAASDMVGADEYLRNVLESLDLQDRKVTLLEGHGKAASAGAPRSLFSRRVLASGSKTIGKLKASVGEWSSGHPRETEGARAAPLKEVSATATGPIAILWLAGLDAKLAAEFIETLYASMLPGGIIVATGPGAVQSLADWRDGGKAAIPKPFVVSVAPDASIGLKPSNEWGIDRNRYDYIPPSFEDPRLMSLFPSLVITDPKPVGWPWFRQDTPHLWRTDTRASKKYIGVLSYEEALILYNLALPFRGKRAVEIGCHLAWSTAHLVAAGLRLDVIDPALGDAKHHRAVQDSVDAVRDARPQCGSARLIAGFSPSVVAPVAASENEKWSVAFIDGWHEDDAPANDARAVLPYMADDAIVVFHDLNAPAVFRGLEVFADAGWSVQYFNTTQVMAVASRGDVVALDYQPDPNMPRPPYSHLDHIA